jgi:hypothetical protein
MDIIYALGSVDKNHGPLFEIQKNITKAIVKQQNSPETKHGLIVFGKDAKEVSPLEDFEKKPKFFEKMEDMKWPSDAKSLAPPLEKGSQIFKEQGNEEYMNFNMWDRKGDNDINKQQKFCSAPNDTIRRS